MLKKIKTLLLLVFISLPLIIFCQDKVSSNSKDMIQVETNFMGTKFYLNNQRVPMKEVETHIATVPEALKYFQKGKRGTIAESIFGSAGGFAIGWEVGNLISGRKVRPSILGVGAGLIGVGIVLHSSTNKSFKKAVAIYRDSNGKIGASTKTLLRYDLRVKNDGALAVVLSF